MIFLPQDDQFKIKLLFHSSFPEHILMHFLMVFVLYNFSWMVDLVMGISELFKKILIFFDTPGLRQQGFETDYSNVDLYHFQSFSQSLLLFSPDFSSLFLAPTSNLNFLTIFAFLEQCLITLG